MTDLESFSIEEGGVDGEEFYLYLNTSDHEKTCGRGRKSNYFSLKEHGKAPPDAGSSIDASLWRIIVKSLALESSKVENDHCPTILMVTLCLVLPLFILIFTVPDDGEDHPVRLVVAFVLFAIMLLSMIVGLPYSARMKNKGYQKVVSVMAPRFQEQGFEIEFIVYYDWYILTCPYVRFTPTGTGRQVGQIDDDLGVFSLHDWKPLEGKWEKAESATRHRLSCFWLTLRPYVYELKKSTFEFELIESRSSQDQALQENDEALNERAVDSLTIDDTTFVSKRCLHIRILGVDKKDSLTGKMTGNTHVMKLANDNGQVEGITTIITPIETGGNASCYRFGDSQVLIVQGSKMLLIDFLYEVFPPVSRLLSDASLLKDGRDWKEFQRNGFGDSASGTSINMPEIV
jgi:hypothetical protein